MQRICSSLAKAGYNVILVGKRTKYSIPLKKQEYKQYRLYCTFTTGKVYYAEFNIKLFFFLLFKRMDALCSIDLDTIVPGYYISLLRKVPRLYDAHELFSEMKEIVTRPRIQKFWLWIERKFVPMFKNGYTVSESIVKEFEKRYAVKYEVIRNVPEPTIQTQKNIPLIKDLIYQGAVNEARGFEQLIPAMQKINANLYIYGDGNFMSQVKKLIIQYGVESKVFLMGMKTPVELKEITANAYIGINLVENIGLNQYYSLANKFFDYMQAGVPQITMRYPEYETINKHYEIAVLIEDITPELIAEAYTKLCDDIFYRTLSQNCLTAAREYNWQNEEKKLLNIYNKLLH